MTGPQILVREDEAARKKHQIYVRVPGELPRARGDRRAVEQALTNFIDNAIKYCPEGARITVRGQVVDDMLEIAVEAEEDELRAQFMTYLAYRSALLRMVAAYAGFESVARPDARARLVPATGRTAAPAAWR